MDTNLLLAPNTNHGLLIAFGEFARQHHLIDELMAVPIPQQTYRLPPQTKLIELLVGILSGIEYLQDLNLGAHPLVKDQAVIQAWDQPAFAHYSNVSRTLEACDSETVVAVEQVIERFSHPFIAQAVQDQLRRGQPLVFDLDLTGQAVSATSQTYPNAAFGWMNDGIQLGYQLARACLHTPMWGRVWLAGFHHPGSTVSAPCLRELILAAEKTAQVRPRRRPELVRLRLDALETDIQRTEQLVTQQANKLHTQRATVARWQSHADRAAPANPAMPTSSEHWQQRIAHVEQAMEQTQRVLANHQRRLQIVRDQRAATQGWLEQLEADNTTNPDAPRCEARMDGGFTSGANLTWLIEMGYIPTTKAPSDKTTQALRSQVTAQRSWVRVGDNAELMGFAEYLCHDCPYPLTVALERFKTGADYKYATLMTYNDTDAMPTLPAWFHHYNARQTIEAGNKEMKATFHVQHLMSRAWAGIQIQVLFTGLAANLVRWCAPWLHTCTVKPTPSVEQTLSSPKRMVRVVANTPAVVQYTQAGLALRFTPQSAWPNVTLFLRGVPAFQPTLGFFQPFEIAPP